MLQMRSDLQILVTFEYHRIREDHIFRFQHEPF